MDEALARRPTPDERTGAAGRSGVLAVSGGLDAPAARWRTAR
ncbi:hypothetical protein [Streptomyces sp. SAI-229]|jgi:hypothetical protein